MTRMTHGPGDAVFPDGERLHDAFAEEVDRPGLEGPSFDAVLRSGTARRRRNRVTTGTTFAVASVAAVATAVLATGGGTSHDVSTAAGSTGTNSTTTAQTSGITTLTSPAAGPAKAAPAHPADVVLTSGTVDGHSWQLVRAYTLDQPSKTSDAHDPAQGSAPKWCGYLNVVADGVKTNAGSGDTPCLGPNGKPVTAANPAEPGFTSIAILDAHHDRLGAVVAGSVSPQIASVTAQCGTQSFTAKTSRPAGDATAYYTFTFPAGSSCQVGTLSFFNAAGTPMAFMSNVLLAAGK